MPINFASEKEREAKEHLESILKSKAREALNDFCVESIFSSFGMATPVIAAFGINTQKVLVEALKEQIQELEEKEIEDGFEG